MSVGENIRRLRRDKSLTLDGLSKLSGVKANHISKLERNESDPKLSTIFKLMNALDCSPDGMLLDAGRMGVSGVLKASLERIEQLPDKDKETIISLIDNFCIANTIKQTIGKDGLSLKLFSGKFKEMPTSNAE